MQELLPSLSHASITFAGTDLGFEATEEGAGLNEFHMELRDAKEDLPRGWDVADV